MEVTQKSIERVHAMSFATVYPLYIIKAEKKNRTKAEVDELIFWLTGYDKKTLSKEIENNSNFVDFFKHAPKFNPNAKKITGMICGYRIEDIKDTVLRKVRYMDKLIDELAKGKSMEKILR